MVFVFDRGEARIVVAVCCACAIFAFVFQIADVDGAARMRLKRREEILHPSERVFGPGASRDDRRMEIDGVIPHAAGFFVARISGKNDVALEAMRKFADPGRANGGRHHKYTSASG